MLMAAPTLMVLASTGGDPAAIVRTARTAIATFLIIIFIIFPPSIK
jgi:hypothetical protein